VLCNCAWSRNLKNEADLAFVGLLRQRNKETALFGVVSALLLQLGTVFSVVSALLLQRGTVISVVSALLLQRGTVFSVVSALLLQ
jgi:hypothetical protein